MCRGERHRSSSVRQRRGARIQTARSAGAGGAARGPGEMAPGRCNHAQVCEDPAYSLGLGRPNPRRIKLLYSAGDPASRVPARDCQARLYTCSAAWLNVPFGFPAGLPAASFAPRDQRDAKPARAGNCREGDRLHVRVEIRFRPPPGIECARGRIAWIRWIEGRTANDSTASRRSSSATGPSRRRSRRAPRIAPIMPKARPAA